MLSNDQCIEVAGKVWGCDLEGIKRFKPQIIHEVSSWQGFGRTVEAMAEREWAFSDSSSTGICFYSRVGDESEIKVTDDWNNPRSLIEATHLAALEALK